MKFTSVKRKLRVLFCLICIMIITASVPTGSSILTGVAKLIKSEGKKTAVIVIDPGHGGMDGGAESSSGTCEKDINLAIALHVKELAEKDGHKVIMTRDDDRLLGDTESGTIRSKKTADLIERKRIIDESKADFAVSIHLNSFKEDRSVHGAQVFYPQGKEDEKVIADSKMLAETVYEKISLGLDDGTNRPVLAKGDVRILKNVSVPTIIVECGFLSNNKEAELLESEEYQKKLAQFIYEGISDVNSLNKTQKSVENTFDSKLHDDETY